MTDYPKKIAEALLLNQAFKISLDPLFTWTSGLRSPVYCDLRALISDVPTRRLIIEAFQELMPFVKAVDIVAGTATAGIPWAAWLAEALGKPMIYVRGESKTHGTQKRIEGLLEAGQKAALIEDHISTGGSSIAAIEALREAGLTVDTLVAINTYELEKAKQAFNAAQVSVHTLINYSIILACAKAQGLITAEQESLLADFREDPTSWAQKHHL